MPRGCLNGNPGGPQEFSSYFKQLHRPEGESIRGPASFADFVAAHPHLFHVFLSHSGKKRIRYAQAAPTPRWSPTPREGPGLNLYLFWYLPANDVLQSPPPPPEGQKGPEARNVPDQKKG